MHFPWASLLEGILSRDGAVLRGVAGLLAPGATAEALVSVVPRDGVPSTPEPAPLQPAYARAGLALAEARPARPAEVAASGSTWAKRLQAGTGRSATFLRLRRFTDDVASDDLRILGRS